jgi:Zn finger protein HypA/HybF involved in hydrogenase expression
MLSYNLYCPECHYRQYNLIIDFIDNVNCPQCDSNMIKSIADPEESHKITLEEYYASNTT